MASEPEIHDERRVSQGAIVAIQRLELPDTPVELLARMGPEAMERLALAYFREAGRLTVGVVRPRVRGEVLELGPPIGPAGLRFRIAERRQEPTGTLLRLRIVGGLLAGVGSERGTLTLALEPAGGHLAARIALEEYQPALARVPGLGRAYYLLQATTHSLHARRFLRRLAREWREILSPAVEPGGAG